MSCKTMSAMQQVEMSQRESSVLLLFQARNEALICLLLLLKVLQHLRSCQGRFHQESQRLVSGCAANVE